MNKNKKLVVTVFLVISSFIVASIGQSGNNLNLNLDHKKTNIEFIDKANDLKISYAVKSAPLPELEIDDEGSKNYYALRWSEARALGICTGLGTKSNPYIIKNRIISDCDGEGGCLSIRDSSAYFSIETCTFLNSIDFGIKIDNTGNGTIINNQFSNNDKGIWIYNAINLTINGNIISNNEIGLDIRQCSNITVLNNIMISCGIIISYTDSKLQMDSLYIDNTNKANGKPIFYYSNKKMLNKNDFNNAGQVILNNCSDVIMSNLNVSKASRGISLHYSCNNVTISNITTSYQNDYGIYGSSCSNITIYNNTANFNREVGIILYGEKCNITENILNYNKYSGILISSNNATINNNIIKYSEKIGIELSYCGNATLKNNNIIRGGIVIDGNELQLGSHFIDKTNTVNGRLMYYYSDKSYLGNLNLSNAGQIILASCENSTITNYNISNIYSGIAIYYCKNITVLNCNISNNIEYGIYVNSAVKCNFTNNIANNISGTGFYFYSYCSFNVIFNNVINNNSLNGIDMSSNCNNNTISKNTINNNNYHGLQLSSYCNNNNITANQVNYNSKNIKSDCGIYVSWCNNNNISNNNANYNYDTGIYIEEGVNNTISNNTLNRNKQYGINLKKGVGNNVTKNIMLGCGLGIDKLYSPNIDELTKNFISSDNQVNNKPLCYETHKVGLPTSTFSNKGQIILINCSYSIISNVNISRTSTGITFYYCDNNTINKVKATYNIFYGFDLYKSSNNNITENMLMNNSESGIIVRSQSYDNRIYANTFINNTVNSEDDGLNTLWNNATIGNYWDDYIGCDNDNDGIGETPYNIPGNAEAKDYKPITTRKCTPIILVDDDDDDEKEEVLPVVVPFGNYYLVFVVLAIITIIIRVKNRKINY